MTNDLFQQAVALAKAGHKEEARELFIRVIESNPMNEAAWLWYSDTLTSLEDRKIALEECLQMIPDSQAARRGLDVLQGKRPASTPTPSRPVQTESVFTASPEESSPAFHPSNPSDLNGNYSVSPFTVSPDSLTDSDLSAAERSILGNLYTGPNEVESRQSGRSFPDFPAAGEPSVGWTPAFSDDISDQTDGKRPSFAFSPQANEAAFSDSEWGDLASLSDDGEEQSLAPSWANTPVEVDAPVDHYVDAPVVAEETEVQPKNGATEPEKKAASPTAKESRESQILFYLGVGIVIVLVLLVAVILLIFSI